mmetsp:Transcript_5114/g.15160  ORF Transcript_5114/g.15160 Transcript_5114/m.15160 type:complete len:424 (-) Transcript_5114:46-1317(-)
MAAPEGDKWECPVCLFENITKNGGVCEFCGEAAPWAVADVPADMVDAPKDAPAEVKPPPPPEPAAEAAADARPESSPSFEERAGEPGDEPKADGAELQKLLEEFEAAAAAPSAGPPDVPELRKAPFRVRAFESSSEQGKRASQEDVYVVTPSIHDDPNCSYFAVFDGHAGSRAAQYCGQRLLDNITSTAAWTRRDVLAAAKFGLARTEQAYLRAALSASPRWFDGTTAVVVLLVDGILTVGWVGDSRAILGRKSKQTKAWAAFELSHDHKPTNPKEYKRILSLGGTVGRSLKEATSGEVVTKAGQGCPVFCFGANVDSPMRCYPGGLSLSRSIGDVTLKYHPKKVVVGDPEVVQQRLSEEDKFIVLACDGIWDVMTNERVVQVAAKAIKDKKDAAKEIVRAAFLLGSTDNMTAVVVHLAPGAN